MTSTNPNIDDENTIVHPRGDLIDIDENYSKEDEDTYLTRKEDNNDDGYNDDDDECQIYL